MNLDQLISVDEAAEVYGCTRARIYQLLDEGRLQPVIDKPRTKLFLRIDIERLAREIVPRRRRRRNSVARERQEGS